MVTVGKVEKTLLRSPTESDYNKTGSGRDWVGLGVRQRALVLNISIPVNSNDAKSGCQPNEHYGTHLNRKYM